MRYAARMFGPLPPLIVAVSTAYAAAGLIVAVMFLLRGIERVDPAARGAYAVRPLLLPGLILLWPIVALRWRVLSRG